MLPLLLLLSLPDTDADRDLLVDFLIAVVVAAADPLAALDDVLDVFDLAAFHTSAAVETLAKRVLARAEQALVDHPAPEVRRGVVGRCLRGLLLYVHEPPDSALPVLFEVSPFGFGLALAHVTKELPHADVLRTFCGPEHADVLSAAGAMLHGELFTVTVGLLELMTTDNEMLVFWRATLRDLANGKRNGSRSLLINQMAPIYIERAAAIEGED